MKKKAHPPSTYAGTAGKWTRDEKKVTEPMPNDKKRVWLFPSNRAAKRFVRSGNPRQSSLA